MFNDFKELISNDFALKIASVNNYLLLKVVNSAMPVIIIKMFIILRFCILGKVVLLNKVISRKYVVIALTGLEIRFITRGNVTNFYVFLSRYSTWTR